MAEKEWVRSFYEETDRPKRKALLERGIEEDGMTPENKLRSLLFQARYGDSENSGQEVDYFIRGWMTLEYMKSASKFFLTKRRVQRELDSLRKDWQFETAAQFGEAGKEILYRELCNLALLYIRICRRDKTYGSFLMGLGRVKDSTLNNRIFDDFYKMAYEIPRAIGAEEELAAFTKAATAMFCREFPEQTDAFYKRVQDAE